jgi:anti-sigma factor RsiW
MSLENHDRARKLLAATRVEGIAAGERDWLDRHLASCPECSSEASALDAAIRSLRAVPVAMSPEVVYRTRMAVYRRAEQLQAGRARAVPLWIATVASAVWSIVTAPYAWETFAWFGRFARVPDLVWQAGFVMWWFLPATVVAAACTLAVHDQISRFDLGVRKETGGHQ